MDRIILKPRKARPFHGRHPWVLDTAIGAVDGSPADGDVVDLVSAKGQWIARGVFNSRSRIRVRLYSWSADEALDDALWRRRFEAALRLRSRLDWHDPQGAMRLVYSEADGLSGLVVDRYGEYLVLQVTALAMAVRLGRIVPLAVELARPRGATVRTERGTNQLEGLEIAEGPCWGEMPDGPVFIREHGVRYGVDLAAGQKTGFFLDQRENRKAAAGYVAGRRLLDMFSYSGGFALCASVLGRAGEVLGIDSSQRAIALARANAELNGLANVRFEVGDGFQALEALAAKRERYGAIVLDPPKFAHSRRAVPEALRAYHQLNRLAVELLQSDGILVTCSCSGHVTRDDFAVMLASVAQRSGREVQILEQRGAAPDHPTSATCLESDYLKCFICRVV